MITIHLIVAARPNFMKVAPLYHALKKQDWCKPLLIHTGQHYDEKMSGVFLRDLKLDHIDAHLGVGSGSHAQQIASVMVAYEALCIQGKPDLVVVAGDVNSTLACALVAKKLHIKLAHLESGLRSFDNTMPEEINRKATDSISDILWTHSKDADENLLKEGVDKDRVRRVGNTMIDTFCALSPEIDKLDACTQYDLSKKKYAVCTFHRPVNVDDPQQFKAIMQEVDQLNIPVIFPVHLRTRRSLDVLKLELNNIKLVEPLSYLEFMNLVSQAKFIITDSGGIQEETTFMRIPCFTLRENTERPVTVTQGSNQLVSLGQIANAIQHVKYGQVPELWDGHAAERIVTHLKEVYL